MTGYLLIIAPFYYSEEWSDKWEDDVACRFYLDDIKEFYYDEASLNYRISDIKQNYDKLFRSCAGYYAEGVEYEVYSCECKYIPNWGE